MGGFLDGYGVADARREKLMRRLALAGLVLAIAGISLYFYFRNYREERAVRSFLQLLQKKDFKAAYALWGCTEASPCRSYGFERFMEDWGPSSGHESARVAKTRSCSAGIIVALEFPKGDPVNLWVERRDRTLGFAPWPVCNPRIPTPSANPM